MNIRLAKSERDKNRDYIQIQKEIKIRIYGYLKYLKSIAQMMKVFIFRYTCWGWLNVSSVFMVHDSKDNDQ